MVLHFYRIAGVNKRRARNDLSRSRQQSVSGEGYTDYHYTASLCGFANADDPEILVYVGLNGVRYLASASSSYLFATIMEEAVNDIGVQPVY